MFTMRSILSKAEQNEEILAEAIGKKKVNYQTASLKSVIGKSFIFIALFVVSVLSVRLLKQLPIMEKALNEFHTSIGNSQKQSEAEKGAANNNSPVKTETTGPTYDLTKDKLTFIMSGLLLSAVVSLLVLILIPSISAFTSHYLVVNAGLFIGLLLNIFKDEKTNNLVLVISAIFFAIILFVYSVTMLLYYQRFHSKKRTANKGVFNKIGFIFWNYALITVLFTGIMMLSIIIFKPYHIGWNEIKEYFHPLWILGYLLVSAFFIAPYSVYMSGTLIILDEIIERKINKKYEMLLGFSLFFVFIWAFIAFFVDTMKKFSDK
ncbi:hypothetical protein [Candidatus Phytoplasma pruni]|uniref:Uncharacterized protein n=1 Tax=Candidatus Phytoplasma pruni TaxID=479893 RepID=A0A851HAQ5_9MOLU|nr:hypothetical protein [Candidatus Phytoplasma pruni]NWN46042.1 hypothetical protein [Candidatus Phytoplasma pruni]